MIHPIQRKAASQVIIALDYSTPVEADRFLTHWRDREKPFIKVGMQLFYAAGPDWVKGIVEEGYPVFLDLKLHDIPHTVAGAVRSLAGLGVLLLTLHATGGREMMEAAQEAATTSSGGGGPRLLAVTQLTSTDQRMMNDELCIPGSVRDSVLHLARLAHQSGIDGVVCSGEEAGMIKERVSREMWTVTPGIRLEGEEQEDQKRVMTPKAAVRAGADLLVVGRSITRSSDPVATYEGMMKQIQWKERDYDE